MVELLLRFCKSAQLGFFYLIYKMKGITASNEIIATIVVNHTVKD